ncbi:hypothetical protein KSZ_30000 [Dictyobacter formicarum]|uniref:Uncharacterized protein n=1 Tax=Dictyobacter formicarum TaxID=2778368 RepID=A0ABQ3VH10_9CHLR|nr:hypothetical protein KSZ_30000 [Dictyobacter formicarum]
MDYAMNQRQQASAAMLTCLYCCWCDPYVVLLRWVNFLDGLSDADQGLVDVRGFDARMCDRANIPLAHAA